MVQARTSAKEFFNADERLADLGLIADGIAATVREALG